MALAGISVQVRSLRKRIEGKLRKRLRNPGVGEVDLRSRLRRLEQSGVPLLRAFRQVMLDIGAGWLTRGTAARVLAIADPAGAVVSLLDLFYSQTEKIELWETALTIENLGDHAAIRLLVRALDDANPHRRHAAARALGWIPGAGRKAARALARVLGDRSQPQAVREEAAESLAYLNDALPVPALITVLEEPDVRIRFWAVFALGGIGQWQSHQPRRGPDHRIVEALERMLSDEAVPSGNWWAIGKEALAMLAALNQRYDVELNRAIERVRGDPRASAEDLRWAESYGRADVR
jgi:hypothetical protein